MRPRTFAFALAPLLALAPACSSSSTSSTPPGKDAAADTGHAKKPDATAPVDAASDATKGGKDAHPDVIIDPQNCVAPGATSSEDGIGGYCSPGGGQCLHAGAGGVATVCTADFGAPAHEWFCTLPCDNTTQCGPGGGTCVVAPFAELCAPAACVAGLGDAGSPDLIDAGTDGGATDAADAGLGHDAADDAKDAALADAARDADGG